jgi:tetratricopeptide (TPR) repeat protein
MYTRGPLPGSGSGFARRRPSWTRPLWLESWDTGASIYHTGHGAAILETVLVRLARKALIAFAMGAAVYYAARGWGKPAGALTAAGCLAVVGALTVWLPRAAHRAYERGDYGRSALSYTIVRWGLIDRAARQSAEVSLAACDLARERFSNALRRLDRVDRACLSEAARSAWYNNRAYALARAGSDAASALECAENAIGLRPEVAGFRHTRGVALLALGRVDEAIRELDAVWDTLDGADAPPLLEAERCYDLGGAWRRKGERDYSRDYFERAQRAAPDSLWAERAAEQLGESRESASHVALPELG